MKQNVRLFKTVDGKNFLIPFILISSLFFLWGFAHSILDVLNKHFQDVLQISKAGSALVQAMVYGGYFLMALPAGELIRRHGYRIGVITGLLLYGTGALMFIPGSHLQSFPFFLVSLFIIGCGLTCLETASNPYVTVLGDPRSAERRINLAQSLNGLGWICGPFVGGLFLFGQGESHIAIPYAAVGIVVLLVAVVFSRIRLPEIHAEEISDSGVPVKGEGGASRLWKSRHFTFGLLALFLYVAAQTGINSFFINYMTDHAAISAERAALWLSFGGMGLFMVGRMAGSWVMKYILPYRLLAVCSIGATLAMILVCLGLPGWGTGAFFFCYLCESIMFPTLFSLAIKRVDHHRERASSYLVMSIVGGAIAPVLMGLIADHFSTPRGFLVPLVCFIGVLIYAVNYPRLLHGDAEA